MRHLDLKMIHKNQQDKAIRRFLITTRTFKKNRISKKDFGFGTQIRKLPFFDPKKQITTSN
jgi:hypothetical protein